LRLDDDELVILILEYSVFTGTPTVFKRYQGLTSPLMTYVNQGNWILLDYGSWTNTYVGYGKQLRNKTYDHNVSVVDAFTPYISPTNHCGSITSDTTASVYFSENFLSFSTSSTTVTFTPESFTMTALTVDVVTIASWEQDIAEPCSIDIEAIVDEEVEATEGESETWTVEGCVQNDSCATYTMTTSYAITSSGTTPTWISYDSTSNEFTITTASEPGDYTVEITCTYSTKVATATQSIKINALVNNAPEFEAAFEDIEVTVGEIMTYNSPQYSDVDPSETFVEVISVPDFVTYTSTSDGSSISFFIVPTTNDQAGDYTIEIEVTD